MPSTHRTPPPSDAELTGLLLHKPEHGIDLLLTHRVPIVIRSLHKRGYALSAQMTDELAIDLSSTVWESIHTFDPAKGSLNTWMIAIASRIVHRYRELSMILDPIEIDRRPASSAESRSVRSVMISERVRGVMREVMSPAMCITLEHDLASPSGRGDTKQIRAEAGGSDNAVYLRRKRAHKTLRKHLQHFFLNNRIQR